MNNDIQIAALDIAIDVWENSMLPTFEQDWNEPHDAEDKTIYDLHVIALKAMKFKRDVLKHAAKKGAA
jgi:hypothetical protein